MIILGIQQKVSAHDCHADGDNHQNQEDQQHESVDIVHLRRKLILHASEACISKMRVFDSSASALNNFEDQ